MLRDSAKERDSGLSLELRVARYCKKTRESSIRGNTLALFNHRRYAFAAWIFSAISVKAGSFLAEKHRPDDRANAIAASHPLARNFA